MDYDVKKFLFRAVVINFKSQENLLKSPLRSKLVFTLAIHETNFVNTVVQVLPFNLFSNKVGAPNPVILSVFPWHII